MLFGGCHLRNGVRSNLVSIGVEILDQTVVGPLVRNEKGALVVATVGVFSRGIKDPLEDLVVVLIDRVFESYQHQLWRLVQRQLTFFLVIYSRDL
jgi:hypothetical protein